jgi:hypothetical protein
MEYFSNKIICIDLDFDLGQIVRLSTSTTTLLKILKGDCLERRGKGRERHHRDRRGRGTFHLRPFGGTLINS